MKSKILMLILACTSVCFSQNRIKFTYDATGNQIKREICINCNARLMASDSIYQNPEEVKASDLISSDAQLSYYPNPVSEQLYVYWDEASENKVSSIEIYSLNGQCLNRQEKLQDLHYQSLNFQTFATGYYNVIVTYTDGERKTLKIVKE